MTVSMVNPDTKKGTLIRGIWNLWPHEAFELCGNGAIIIDIRPDYLSGYKKFAVESVLYFPRNEMKVPVTLLDPGTIYIIAGTCTGIHSRETANSLMSQGLSEVYNLAGGIVEWERNGFPVLVDNNARLSGSCVCRLRYRG